MSNGIDNLATGAMTAGGPEITYAGQSLAGDLNASPDAINIDGVAQIVETGATIGNNVESMNDLGTARNLNIQSSQRGN